MKRAVHDDGARPNTVHQFVFGDQFAGRLRQNFDDLEGAPAHRRGRSEYPQFAASKIDLALTRSVNPSNALSEHGNGPLCNVCVRGFS